MANRAKRKRLKRKRARRSERRRREQHTLVAKGPDSIDHASCPVCVDLAARGEMVWVRDADGVRQVDASEWPAPVLIEVKVRGDATLRPMFSAEPTPLRIPVGCTLEMFVQYLFFRDRVLALVARDDGVVARINGELSPHGQLLREGDEVSLTLGAPAPALVSA